MNNIKDKFRELLNNRNMKIIIPAIVLLVLLIVSFILLREYKYNNYRNKKDLMFYQYFGEAKIEYEATVSYNKKDVIKAFSPKEYKINYESNPIYMIKEDDNENKNTTVIFPSEMSIVLPLKNQSQYKIPEFSYVEKVNDIHYLTFEDYDKNIDHYVMFDGKSLYFFSDSVKFVIDDEEITLSPMSYIINSKDYFSYYDYESDTYKMYDYKVQVLVYNDYYKINTRNDNIEYFGENILLTNDLSYLKYLKEK